MQEEAVVITGIRSRIFRGYVHRDKDVESDGLLDKQLTRTPARRILVNEAGKVGTFPSVGVRFADPYSA